MAVDFDALVLAPCIATYGEAVVYTPQGHAAFGLSGVFDSAHSTIDFTEGAPVSTMTPVLGVRLADFPPSIAPLQGDGPVLCRGVAYLVADVEPDGHGGAKLILKLAA